MNNIKIGIIGVGFVGSDNVNKKSWIELQNLLDQSNL